MDNTVVIKSFPNGISIHLDADIPFEELLLEIEDKFTDSAKFFSGSRLALSLEGRSLTPDQEKQLVKAVTARGGLNIVCLIGKDQEKDDLYVRAIHRTAPPQPEENPVQFYKGTIKAGQTVESQKSMIILGNVEAGARVVSDHDIIVIGELSGEAFAGTDGSDGHFIAALFMKPEKLKIADVKYRDSGKGIFKKKGKQAQIALVRDTCIIVQDITKELLNDLGKNIM